MGWRLVETSAPLMRWTMPLTAQAPEAGWQSMALLERPTLHVEGTFGAGAVEVGVSNSGQGSVPVDVLRHAELLVLPPAAFVTVRVVDADESTDLVITLAGRR